MITPYSSEIEKQMQELYSRLPEKNRHLYAGIEALKLPYGGVSYVARPVPDIKLGQVKLYMKIVIIFKKVWI
jgi:hypothetical protein